jgi:hypothetical protein
MIHKLIFSAISPGTARHIVPEAKRSGRAGVWLTPPNTRERKESLLDERLPTDNFTTSFLEDV